jgi:hypothetical protein
MVEEPKGDRQELERRLAQSRRLAAQPNDPLTQARLDQLVRELEGQIGERRQAPSPPGVCGVARPRQ